METTYQGTYQVHGNYQKIMKRFDACYGRLKLFSAKISAFASSLKCSRVQQIKYHAVQHVSLYEKLFKEWFSSLMQEISASI